MGLYESSENTIQHYNIEKIVPSKKLAYEFFKRLLDLSFSLLFFILLLIPMVFIAIIIKLDSKGSVIFKQERVGKNGKKFMMYKFRTMKTDAEKDGPQWADNNDSRCTRVGKFLRAVRLDELPQVLNVIKGDMSFVGPRPERQYFYDEFEKYIHGFSYRTAVTPGITGWAQVNGGYDLLPEEKIVYDMEYIKNRSMLLDLKCFFLTIKVVFTREGSR